MYRIQFIVLENEEGKELPEFENSNFVNGFFFLIVNPQTPIYWIDKALKKTMNVKIKWVNNFTLKLWQMFKRSFSSFQLVCPFFLIVIISQELYN
jgi:hypothetical protein